MGAGHPGGWLTGGRRALDTADSGRAQDGAAEPDPRLFVTSVERAMKVLEAFDAGRGALSISDIAQATGLGRSAAQRFIYTLHHLGYLRRDPNNRQYSVSHRVVDLAKSLLGANTASERILPVLEQIARQTQETVAWVELDGLEIVVLRSVPSTHLSSVNLPMGQRFAALSSSSGQVLLAHKTDAEILAAYRASSDYARGRFGRTGEAEVLAYFHAVRQHGFAVTEKMEDQDSMSISAPVLGAGNAAIGAINVSALKTRYVREQFENELAPSLTALARKVSQEVFRAA